MAFMPKIDELESLLEAYFVQIDGTLNKLSTVRSLVLLYCPPIDSDRSMRWIHALKINFPFCIGLD